MYSNLLEMTNTLILAVKILWTRCKERIRTTNLYRKLYQKFANYPISSSCEKTVDPETEKKLNKLFIEALSIQNIARVTPSIKEKSGARQALEEIEKWDRYRKYRQEEREVFEEKMSDARVGSLVRITGQSFYLEKWTDTNKYNLINSFLDPSEDIFIPVRKGGIPAGKLTNVWSGPQHDDLKLVLAAEGSVLMWLGWVDAKDAWKPYYVEKMPVWLLGSQKIVGWIRGENIEIIVPMKTNEQ